MKMVHRVLGLAAIAWMAGCGAYDGAGASDRGDSATGTATEAFSQGALADGSWGGNNEGGGIALAQINGTGGDDMVLFRIDAPNGANQGYYRVGYDMALYQGGTYAPTSYGPFIAIPGWFGSYTGGADVATGDINGNGTPDVLFLWVDQPTDKYGDPTTNQTYYRIGWDMQPDGSVTSWSDTKVFQGGFHGDYTSGAGVALRDLDGDGKMDLIVGTVDDPSGENKIYVSVGWDLDDSGNVSNGWSPSWTKPLWTGSHTSDMALHLGDFNGNGQIDIVVAWVDNPDGADQMYYQIAYDFEVQGGPASWGPFRKLGPALGSTTHAAGLVGRDFDKNGSRDLLGFTIDGSTSSDVAHLWMAMDRSDTIYAVDFPHAGGCLIPSGGNGSGLVATSCDTSNPLQQWTFTANDDGYYNLVNVRTGQWAEMSPGSSGDWDGKFQAAAPASGLMVNEFSLRSDQGGWTSLEVSTGWCISSLYPYSAYITEYSCDVDPNNVDNTEIIDLVKPY